MILAWASGPYLGQYGLWLILCYLTDRTPSQKKITWRRSAKRSCSSFFFHVGSYSSSYRYNLWCWGFSGLPCSHLLYWPLCQGLFNIWYSSRCLSNQHLPQLWDLSSRSLLTTFHFPQPISYLAWDVTERLFFAASADGSIHQMNLFRERASKFGGIITESVGGAGVTDIIRVDDDVTREARKKRLISVGYSLFLHNFIYIWFDLLESQYRVFASR
jgi:hypothetical protein